MVYPQKSQAIQVRSGEKFDRVAPKSGEKRCKSIFGIELIANTHLPCFTAASADEEDNLPQTSPVKKQKAGGQQKVKTAGSGGR